MKKREDGYYWVIWNDRWVIAEYCDGYWYLFRERYDVEEESLGEVNENRIVK